MCINQYPIILLIIIHLNNNVWNKVEKVTISSCDIQLWAKWQFCNTTQLPILVASDISLEAIGPCPWPNDKAEKRLPNPYGVKTKKKKYIMMNHLY